MSWNIQYLPEAKKDLESLDGSQRRLVVKAIAKVSTNPLPDYEGGYGKPLGNRNNSNLAGCMKIKLKASGLRIVYKIEKLANKCLLLLLAQEPMMRFTKSLIQESTNSTEETGTNIPVSFFQVVPMKKSQQNNRTKNNLSHLPLDSIETL